MPRRSKIKNIHYYIIAIIFAILLLVLPSSNFQETLQRKISPGESVPLIQPYHAHADFKVFLDGTEVNFSKPHLDVANKYMHLHLRNPDGDKVIHMEGMENVTLGLFFESLNMKFNSTCFIYDEEDFCNKLDKRIRLFVNDNENFQFDFYEPRNLDRTLILYGNETGDKTMELMNNITDYACIYSGRCPEKIPTLPVPEEQLIF